MHILNNLPPHSFELFFSYYNNKMVYSTIKRSAKRASSTLKRHSRRTASTPTRSTRPHSRRTASAPAKLQTPNKNESAARKLQRNLRKYRIIIENLAGNTIETFESGSKPSLKTLIESLDQVSHRDKLVFKSDGEEAKAVNFGFKLKRGVPLTLIKIPPTEATLILSTQFTKILINGNLIYRGTRMFNDSLGVGNSDLLVMPNIQNFLRGIINLNIKFANGIQNDLYIYHIEALMRSFPDSVQKLYFEKIDNDVLDMFERNNPNNRFQIEYEEVTNVEPPEF